MNYYVLLKIPVPESEFFIEVGLDYDIPFHPNLTDEIEVAGFPCKINEIYYSFDDLNYISIRVEANDCLLSTRKKYSDEQIHGYLQKEYEELKEWTSANKERLVLNDYYMNPTKPYKKMRSEE